MCFINTSSFHTFTAEVWNTFVAFAAAVLPVITVSLELNSLISPELRSLSILFTWFFIIKKLCYFEGVGIFFAGKISPNSLINEMTSLINNFSYYLKFSKQSSLRSDGFLYF